MGDLIPLTIQAEALALQGYAPEAIEVDSGQTIEGMLCQVLGVTALSDALRAELTVVVAAQPVPPCWWPHLKPKAAVPVYVAHHGLRGGNAGMILRLAGMVALSYFTFGGGTIAGWSLGTSTAFGTFAVQAGAYMLGTLALNALVPVTNTGSTSTSSDGSWGQLTDSSNQLNQWGVIPFVVGGHRLYPPKAAITYTEVLGEDSWIRLLLDLGYDIEADDVSDIRFKDTSISDFSGIEYEITTTPTIYTNDFYEESVAVTMDAEGAVVQRTGTPNATSTSLDLIYTSGLFGVGTSGKKFTLYTKWDIEYRATGTDEWVKPSNPRLSGMAYNAASDTYDVNAQNQKPFAVGIAWDHPAGQYDTRVIRVENGSSTGGSDNTYVESATYSVLRSIKDVTPSTTGTTKLAMRIKTGDDLTGSVDSVNCVVTPKIKVYDRTNESWSDPQHSTNLAWCVYWLMTTCRGFAKHVPASRMDLDAWADYAEFCDLHALEARTVCDSGTTAKVFINKILAGGLASLGEQGGRYRPVFDEGSNEEEWTYTALEVTNFKVSRAFTNLPQALRVQFVNPSADYADDEIIVLDDGYSYQGVDARGNASSAPEPTEYETYQLDLAMEAQQAWKLGRYHFAQAKFRPNTYTIDLDIAGLPARRGALIAVPHDVIDSCVGVGRITDLTTTNVPGGYAAMLQLDETIETEPTGTYKLQLRSADGFSKQIFDCTPASPYSRNFLLASKPVVEMGDAAVLYLASQEIEKVIVSNVKYSTNYATTLTAVDHDARVAPYWADPPENIASVVTGATYDTPDTPVVTAVVSSTDNDDSDDATIKTATIHIALGKTSGLLAMEVA